MRTPEQIFAEAERRVGQWIGAKIEGSAQEVLGRYYLEKLLGCGGMGAVYQAYDYDLDRRIAFKIVNPLGMPEYGSRFRREGRSMARLNCTNIVKVYDIGSNGDELFLTMEILDGEDLEARLGREGVFGEDRFDEAVDIIMQALYGLAHAHVHGVTHRDMKPANLFLAREGSQVLKVLDFGIARMNNTSVTALTQAGSIMGTPQYMSPEQLGGAEAMGPKSDVFSLGVIWYEMFTGEQAYGRPPPGATKNPDWAKLVAWRAIEISKGFGPYLETLPTWLTEQKPEFVKVLARVLDPDPEKRYEGAMETLKALAEATGRTAPPAPEVSTFAEMTRMMPTYSPTPSALADNNASTLHDQPPARPNFATLTPKPVTTPKGLPGVWARRPPAAAFAAAGIILVLVALLVIQLSAPSKARSSHDAGVAAARPQPTVVNTPSDAGSNHDSGFVANIPADASIEFVGDAADAAVQSEVDATSEDEDTGRRGRHRDRDDRRNNSAPPGAQTEAEQLRAELVRACCAGQGGGSIAQQLRTDPDHSVRGLDQCQVPDPPCDIVHGDRRPWCLLCQPRCRRRDRRPECSSH